MSTDWNFIWSDCSCFVTRMIPNCWISCVDYNSLATKWQVNAFRSFQFLSSLFHIHSNGNLLGIESHIIFVRSVLELSRLLMKIINGNPLHTSKVMLVWDPYHRGYGSRNTDGTGAVTLRVRVPCKTEHVGSLIHPKLVKFHSEGWMVNVEIWQISSYMNYYRIHAMFLVKKISWYRFFSIFTIIICIGNYHRALSSWENETGNNKQTRGLSTPWSPMNIVCLRFLTSI